jgi:glycine/D-amino acid oxidase-like deaminating enzyme/nitrite reductase/ring-hydroxylating ferredoxin subunit
MPILWGNGAPARGERDINPGDANMRSDSGKTVSVWMDSTKMPTFAPLEEDLSCDVCVVGAGIVGLTTAYHLVRGGADVVVLDDGPVCGGETSRTTAHLTAVLDDRFQWLEHVHGEAKVRESTASHLSAINRIESIVREEGIACEFERVPGYLLLGKSDAPDFLDRELEAAKRAGLSDARKLARIPDLAWDSGPCLEFPLQAQFHPLKYLAGVTRAIVRGGGRIFTGTHVDSIEGRPRRPQVKTRDKNVVTANAVIVATNSPISDYVVTHVKMAPYRTYVIGALIPRGAVPPSLVWDTDDPYIYVRTTPLDDSHDVLIVGGEDHKTGQKDDAPDRFRRLEEWTRRRYPMVLSIAYEWSGQVMEPADGFAMIGPNPDGAENVYLATADSGQGMTHGTIAGMLLADLAVGKSNPWAELYDPRRKSLGAIKEMVRENLNVAVQYGDWLTPGESSFDDIPRGEGRLVRMGAHKVAAYRDDKGLLHLRDATCTHLRCIVDWNSTEKSWDCPCHGSRFDPEGRVLNGPALADLAPVNAEVADRAGTEVHAADVEGRSRERTQEKR